jgi:hypothetical protein
MNTPPTHSPGDKEVFIGFVGVSGSRLLFPVSTGTGLFLIQVYISK